MKTIKISLLKLFSLSLSLVWSQTFFTLFDWPKCITLQLILYCVSDSVKYPNKYTKLFVCVCVCACVYFILSQIENIFTFRSIQSHSHIICTNRVRLVKTLCDASVILKRKKTTKICRFELSQFVRRTIFFYKNIIHCVCLLV